MFRLITLLVFLIAFSLLRITTPAKAYAAENFTTAYDVTYEVQETGVTHVIMKVKLTNTSSQYFASSYKINLGFNDISAVTGNDPKGKLSPRLSPSPEGYTIAVTFKEKVVGKGKSLPFVVEFDTKDIARKRGSIWSVDIPGIADQEGFSSFVVAVKVPPSFGKPTYIKPEQSDNSLVFTKTELGTGGISLAFGEKQSYAFYLTYHLKNPNLFPVTKEIALPANTNYQDVFYSSIQPKPGRVTVDTDGNWIARFTLKPSESLDIIALGTAVLRLVPSSTPESDERLSLYLKPQKYWEVDDKAIQELAKKLKTPEAIYEYVRTNLTYDFDRVTASSPRLGAKAVVNDTSSAVCLEYTDLFITLARSAGIPAREVNGYAYTENDRQRPLSLVKDILHAWPEYYDRKKETWIMVDPTWGSTTRGIDYFNQMDFDHFSFVRKGVSSTTPIPAGGYKSTNDEEEKDVHVEFASDIPQATESFAVTLKIPNQQLSWLPIRGNIQVSNTGLNITKPTKLTIAVRSLVPVEKTLEIPALPPYGSTVIPVSYTTSSLLTNETASFTIQLAGKKYTKEVVLSPFARPTLPYIIGGIIGICSIGLLILTLKSGGLPLLRRE